MTTPYNQAIEYGQQTLNHLLNSTQDAHTLLAHIANKTTAQLLAYPEQTLSTTQWTTFKQLINKRSKHTPLEYLTQKADFFNLTLSITTDVLIPRDETEQLIDYTLKNHGAKRQKILDLGTGSGCIALALKHNRPQWEIHGCDHCSKALAVAKKNSQQQKLNITFYKSHWFSEIPLQTFDAIITNPPYVDPKATQHTEYTFEPDSARFAQKGGLADILHIIEHAPPYLTPNATLIIEHGFDQKSVIWQALKNKKFTHITTHLDHQNHPRFTTAKR